MEDLVYDVKLCLSCPVSAIRHVTWWHSGEEIWRCYLTQTLSADGRAIGKHIWQIEKSLIAVWIIVSKFCHLNFHQSEGQNSGFLRVVFLKQKAEVVYFQKYHVKIEQLYWRLNLPRSQGATHSSLSACLMMVSGRGREWRTMAPYSPYSAMMLPRPHVLEVFRSLARRFWNQTCHSNHVSIIVVLLPHPRLSLGPSFHLNGRADC